MLTTIKDKATGWIAWAIVILISIPFALWGINSYFEGASKVVVASVGDVEIEREAYQQALAQQQRTLVQMMGGEVDPEFFGGYLFKERVINQLIDDVLFNEYIDSRGYRISDRELNTQIRSIEAFHSDYGFSSDRYQQLLQRAGLSVEGFEVQQRREAVFDQVENGLIKSAFALDSSVRALLTLLHQKREAKFVLFNLEDYIDSSLVGDAEIEAEYVENAEKYFSPESVQVDYVILSVDDLAKDITIDEAEIELIYERDRERFVQPEARSIRHILIAVSQDATEDEIEEKRIVALDLLAKLADGVDFSEVAKDNSDDIGSARVGGDLGVMQLGTMPQAFETTALDLLVGEVSEPIRTEYGFHIVEVTELIPETYKSYSDVRDQLAEEVRVSQAEMRFVETAEELRNISYEQPDTLQPVLDRLGLTLMRSPWFSRGFGDGVATSQAFRDAAFSDDVILDGLNSEVIEIDVNTLAVMRKSDYQERTLRSLDDVKNQIRDKLGVQNAFQELEMTGMRFVKDLNNNDIQWSDWIAANAFAEESFSDSASGGADAVNSSINSIIYDALPSPDESSVFGSKWVNDKILIVYQLRAVDDGDPSSVSAEDREEAKQLLVRRNGAELVSDFKRNLRVNADVSIYEDEL